MKILLGMGFFFALINCVGLAEVTALADVPRETAILAIVGEAEGESYLGKVALAEALRNRGTVKGVYGVKSSRLKKAPKWVFDQAAKAWDESAHTNHVNGADHWESTDFKTPYWAKGMTETARIGKHRFFKAVQS